MTVNSATTGQHTTPRTSSWPQRFSDTSPNPVTPPIAQDWRDARWGDGCEHPDDLDRWGEAHLVQRCFVFVDLCEFTRFCDSFGPGRATAELDRFRTVVRSVAARRGVRVAKWVGDGAMLVAIEEGPAISAAVEVVGRVTSDGMLSARGAITRGPALLFDGDDHIGEPVNLAARLCDAAGTGEVLSSTDITEHAPSWVVVGDKRLVEVRGVTEVGQVASLRAGPGVSFAGHPVSQPVNRSAS